MYIIWLYVVKSNTSLIFVSEAIVMGCIFGKQPKAPAGGAPAVAIGYNANQMSSISQVQLTFPQSRMFLTFDN